MRRAFVTLYGLVVASVLLFGWGLDRVWQFYSPAKEIHRLSPETFAVLDFFLSEADAERREKTVAELAETLNSDITLVQLDDFAQTALADRISAGMWTVVDGGESGMRYYQKLADSDAVISWSQPQQAPRRSLLYEALLIVFYFLIALVIFVWIWPLSRDLAKLEKQTKALGYHSVPEGLQLSPASAVYDLASAFNRMAQRIRELLTTQKEMTYAVSHELRTPLARMKFGLEMASAFNDVERIREKLAGVRDDVSEMDLLVNQLLAYAEFDQQKNSLDFQSGDLDALIRQLIERVRFTGNDDPVEFIFENSLQGKQVCCEWYLMERALLNVLQNARRFARSQVFIWLNKEQGCYRLLVDDDGPGVPEEDRARVFQSFVRINNSFNSQSRGFGLGLSIVQRIMSWHGGGVTLTQAPIGGARFILSWPLELCGGKGDIQAQ